MADVFIAYPSRPTDVGTAVKGAIDLLRARTSSTQLLPWPELPIAGHFIGTTVLEAIAGAKAIVADISELNFNVTYEIGYAIGRGKPVSLVRHAALQQHAPTTKEVGIFDTLGYSQYQNSGELAGLLEGAAGISPLPAASEANIRVPVYMLEGKHKTDWAIRIVSRLKKARLFYRSFDAAEQVRLSAHDAIRQVAQSHGVLVPLIPQAHVDSDVHNQRAAFIAGLANGMGKVATLLQIGDDPVPLDYRDLVVRMADLSGVDEAIAEFAAQVAEAIQGDYQPPAAGAKTRLAQLTFGASTAENEMKDLSRYYLETDAFQRTLRGEIRLVVGRKGSGKTALFLTLRDAVRADRDNVVLDLKPDGYQLVRFKETVLDLLSLGTVEHTITAFWEYLLLLELCHKLLENDRQRHIRDHKLYAPYQDLASAYASETYVPEGDFAERMSTLLAAIGQDYHARHGSTTPTKLSDPEVTALLYRHDLRKLRGAVVEYLRFKGVVWLLFDNVDKGWPAHGLKPEDILIIRSLTEAARKLERQLDARQVQCHTVVFLRNDVYEVLVDQTPDRGKDSRALVDWSDADMLRELVRLRIASGLDHKSDVFDQLWRSVCVSHIDGEETSEYLIARCLMRPRWLLDLLGHCRAFAVNLRHDRIEAEDIRKGLAAYSTDVLTDLDYEIRDVNPQAENALYAFIDTPSRLTEAEVHSRLIGAGIPESSLKTVMSNLVWYGFLGLVRGAEEVAYIYSPGINYSMHHFEAIERNLRGTQAVTFALNPAFWAGLSTTT